MSCFKYDLPSPTDCPCRGGGRNYYDESADTRFGGELANKMPITLNVPVNVHVDSGFKGEMGNTKKEFNSVENVKNDVVRGTVDKGGKSATVYVIKERGKEVVNNNTSVIYELPQKIKDALNNMEIEVKGNVNGYKYKNTSDREFR